MMETTQHPMYQRWYQAAEAAATRMSSDELTTRRDGAERLVAAERPGSSDYVCSVAMFSAYDRELIRRSITDTVAASVAR